MIKESERTKEGNLIFSLYNREDRGLIDIHDEKDQLEDYDAPIKDQGDLPSLLPYLKIC